MTRINRLVNWFKAEPTIRYREPIVPKPVSIESVEPADLPSKQIEAATKVAQEDLTQALLRLGRRSYELRMALGHSALAQVNGGSSK